MKPCEEIRRRRRMSLLQLHDAEDEMRRDEMRAE